MDIVCFPGVLVEEVPRTNRQRIMLEFAELHHVLYVEPPKLPLLQAFKAVGRVMPEQRSMKWFVFWATRSRQLGSSRPSLDTETRRGDT
jgi:hypothetical protein